MPPKLSLTRFVAKVPMPHLEHDVDPRVDMRPAPQAEQSVIARLLMLALKVPAAQA